MYNCMPRLLLGNELKEALQVLPEYSKDIRQATAPERLMALTKLHDIFYPSPMACEIYHKLFFAYTTALKKKLYQKSSFGVSGGRDCFSILGVSGIGKSSAVERAISVISKDELLTINNSKIVPFLVVQTPSDSSIKGLLLEILRLVDERLKTRYYNDAIRAKATVDMLIGLVSKVSFNHLLVLIVDEAQHMLSKNGKGLANVLVQLINSAGISLCFVGVPESMAFFESVPHLARRTIGLSYGGLANDSDFEGLCRTLFRYQYTSRYTALTQELVDWVYLHSGGVLAIAVGLIYTAQELAILEGKERLDMDIFIRAHRQRFQMVHSHIDSTSKKGNYSQKSSAEALATPSKTPMVPLGDYSLCEIIGKAKRGNKDLISDLRHYILVEEIGI